MKRALQSKPAEISDTSTPTGTISRKVIGQRKSGLAYCTLNRSISAMKRASSAPPTPAARFWAISELA